MFLFRLLVLVAIISGLLSSCSQVDSRAALVRERPAPTETPVEFDRIPTPTPDQGHPPQTGTVNFRGVTLTPAIPGVTAIQPTLEEEYPLSDPTYKPDGVEPQNIKLSVLGPYADRDTFFSPRLQIFPVDEYREAWRIEPRYVKIFDQDIKRLKDAIALKSRSADGLLGLSPYCDCSATAISHVKYVSFKNGSGVLYLALFSIEVDILRNRTLTYIFQGFTSDGKYYVFGSFPVSSKVLPGPSSTDEYMGYKASRDFFRKDGERTALYEKYLGEIKAMLERQKPGDFNPNLETIEKTIKTLEITDQ